ncbi:MAG: hypothetical protein DWQ07_11225 [Chloroflexi bacterium]|nr:MAG: hypothetical protein DWQ07_11225 [Chloroflexota bacterium]MBL1192713.1 hypothetical protein [Chloroflexota bacterium]NOH10005.1 hypothetical protein [Chloroflexota bacterium]
MLEMIWFWITAAYYFVIAIFVILFFLLIFVYNEVHYSRYKKLMSHLEEHHNEIYEEIRIKPVIGPLYPNGVYRKSMMYAKDHPPIDDPVAEELFADYARVSQLGLRVFRDIIVDIINRRLDLGYNKQDIRAGAIAGMIVGSISGAIIGSLEIPIFPFSIYVALGPFWGAIVGLLGGIAAGVYSAVREFGWEMSPVARAIIGAVFGAFSWVMALSVLRSMSGIFF